MYVQPLLEYASPVWDPQQKLLVASLEHVQKFGLHMCCKHWDLSYDNLLDWAQIPALKTRWTVAKIILFCSNGQ